MPLDARAHSKGHAPFAGGPFSPPPGPDLEALLRFSVEQALAVVVLELLSQGDLPLIRVEGTRGVSCLEERIEGGLQRLARRVPWRRWELDGMGAREGEVWEVGDGS